MEVTFWHQLQISDKLAYGENDLVCVPPADPGGRSGPQHGPCSERGVAMWKLWRILLGAMLIGVCGLAGAGGGGEEGSQQRRPGGTSHRPAAASQPRRDAARRGHPAAEHDARRGGRQDHRAGRAGRFVRRRCGAPPTMRCWHGRTIRKSARFCSERSTGSRGRKKRASRAWLRW